jgi:hypothetical protein
MHLGYGHHFHKVKVQVLKQELMTLFPIQSLGELNNLQQAVYMTQQDFIFDLVNLITILLISA